MRLTPPPPSPSPRYRRCSVRSAAYRHRDPYKLPKAPTHCAQLFFPFHFIRVSFAASGKSFFEVDRFFGISMIDNPPTSPIPSFRISPSPSLPAIARNRRYCPPASSYEFSLATPKCGQSDLICRLRRRRHRASTVAFPRATRRPSRVHRLARRPACRSGAMSRGIGIVGGRRRRRRATWMIQGKLISK